MTIKTAAALTSWKIRNRDYDVRTQLVRHLHADMVSLPSYRRTGKSHFRKACSTKTASDETAYGRLCELGGDLGFFALVALFWALVGKSQIIPFFLYPNIRFH